jgi:hypothetical protein
VPKLVWRVKVITELEPGVATEAEVARIERGEEAGLAELGLRLEEAKRLTAALQAEIVTAQVATAGERPRPCAACGQMLVSKGHYRATFRSLFGDVPVRVRRLLACPCQAVCCMGRQFERTEPYPRYGSRDAHVLRPPKVEHAVQGLGGNGDLGRLSPIRLRA